MAENESQGIKLNLTLQSNFHVKVGSGERSTFSFDFMFVQYPQHPQVGISDPQSRSLSRQWELNKDLELI